VVRSGIEARRRAALEDGGSKYIARRKAIVQAAALVFRERGFEAATLADVAAALKVDRASLYYYVGSKDELLHDIFSETLNRDIEKATKIRRSRAGSRDKIRALILAMVQSYADSYPHMNFYIQDLPRIARRDNPWSVDVITRTRTYVGLVNSILDKARQDGTLRTELSAELCSLALFGMINWMHIWFEPNVKWVPEEIADNFFEVFLNGYGRGGNGPEAPPECRGRQ
jgi:AcrR family transcriptional regulator